MKFINKILAAINGGTPGPHALAGAEHTASTLLALNTKISDADLYSKAQVDALIAGGIKFIGGYTVSTNTPDLETPAGGAVKQGDLYRVTGPDGDFFTEALEDGDSIIALVDDPSSLTDWLVVNKNIIDAEILRLATLKIETVYSTDAANDVTHLFGEAYNIQLPVENLLAFLPIYRMPDTTTIPVGYSVRLTNTGERNDSSRRNFVIITLFDGVTRFGQLVAGETQIFTWNGTVWVREYLRQKNRPLHHYTGPGISGSFIFGEDCGGFIERTDGAFKPIIPLKASQDRPFHSAWAVEYYSLAGFDITIKRETTGVNLTFDDDNSPVFVASNLEYVNKYRWVRIVYDGGDNYTVFRLDSSAIVAGEIYASTNARFFGELGVPSSQQTWVDTATGSTVIDLVTQNVFGETKQVVRYNDDFADGATTSQINLTAQNWIDINAFGASFGGVSRLDTANGANGFFTGLQADVAENPIDAVNRRYGILIDNNGGNLRLIEADNTGNNVTMDGTGGNPLILFDEWFIWECVVPAGLGAAEFYINGDLITFVPTFFVNGGGLGTKVLIGSGSTGGVDRVTYHDSFGVTIYEESATKTLLATTMVADLIQVFYPSGKRDYTTILPDGNDRSIGARLDLIKANVGGTITLTNQNPSVPEILYNGLKTLTLNTDLEETVRAVNTVDNDNIYLGFISEKPIHIGGNFIDVADQLIAVVNIPQDITFSTNKLIEGLSHTAGSATFTIDSNGLYSFRISPQVAQGAGTAIVEFWIQKNGVNIPDSGIQETISANSEALPILNWKERFVATDTFKLRWASNSANTKLDNITSLFGGPNITAIMLQVTKVGN